MSQNLLPLIASRLVNTPLLLHPDKAAVIYSVLEGRITLDVDATQPVPQPEGNRFIGSRNRQRGGTALVRAHGHTALITITDTLINRGAFINAASGLTSYEGIAAQIREAAGDDEIKNIVLDISSPGGEVGGLFNLAASIRRLAKTKYVAAVVDDMAASAAYALASAADEIVVSPTSVVGSIGVILVHMDRSAEMAAKGQRPTLIYAGQHKADGHPFGPLPESVRADLQQTVMTLYDQLIATVEAGRGKSRLPARKARATEARTFLGQAGIDAGLADRIGTLDDVLAELSRPARATTPRQRRSGMNPASHQDDDPAPEATLSAGTIQAIATETAGAFAAVLDARGLLGKPAAAAPASAPPAALTPEQIIKAERERSAAIRALPEAKGREKLANALADGGATVDQAKAALTVAPMEAAGYVPVAERSRGEPEMGGGAAPAPTGAAIKDMWAKALKTGKYAPA